MHSFIGRSERRGEEENNNKTRNKYKKLSDGKQWTIVNI
jgi:hypothetical protein